MDDTRKFLKEIGIDEVSTDYVSSKRFADGGQYRFEVPGIQSPKTMRTLLTLLALVFSVSGFSDNYKYLAISQTNNETQYELSQIQKITFDSSDMIMTLSNGDEQRLPLASLQKLFFSNGSVDAITTTKNDLSTVRVKDGQLHVQVAEGEHLIIYNMKGEAVFSASKPTTRVIDNLPKGIYIVKTGHKSQKIIK